MMKNYLNLSGKSGVQSYEIGENSIVVFFINGWYYLYTYSSTGELDIEKMKLLAESGQGLNSYIKKTVSDRYEDNWSYSLDI